MSATSATGWGLFGDRELACAREALAQLQPRPDQKAAEKAAKHLYEVLKEPEPKVLWLPSPMVCAKELSKTLAERTVRSRNWRRDENYRRHEKKWKKRPLPYVAKTERKALMRLVRESTRTDERIQEGLLWYGEPKANREEIGGVLQRNTHARNIRFAVAKMAIWELPGGELILRKMLTAKSVERTEAWKELYLTSYFAFLRRGVVALSAPPVEVNKDANGRLHAEFGPALRYSDGSRLWMWHGRQVPKRLIQFPHRIKVWEIEQEMNVEVRRVMMERYGLERYLKDSHSTLVNKGKLGKLYRIRYGDGTWAQFVLVTNSTPEDDGSYKEYVLQVRPHELRADAAIAWTFGFRDEKKYRMALEQQT